MDESNPSDEEPPIVPVSDPLAPPDPDSPEGLTVNVTCGSLPVVVVVKDQLGSPVPGG